MADNYEHGVPVKEEWLDDVILESTEDDIIQKEEPSCDVTLKIFDEPYIPPVYSKVGRTGAISEVNKKVEASVTDGVSNMEADEYRHQYESSETFGGGSSCFEQSEIAGRSRSRERGEDVMDEPSDDGDGESSQNTYVETSLDEICGYSGYRGDGDGSNNIVAHNVGSEERPFACSMCNYNSSSSYHLKRHMLGHSGEKPFACSYCDYKSHRNDKVKRHARTHTGEKPFGCTYCQYKASRADHLKAHIRSHVMKGLGKHFSRILGSK